MMEQQSVETPAYVRGLRTLKGVLEPLGLYKVNEAFVVPLKTKLQDTERQCDPVEKRVKKLREITQATGERDTHRAAEHALELFEINDEVAELKTLRERVGSGTPMEAALASVDTVALPTEIARSTRRELEALQDEVRELSASTGACLEAGAERAQALPTELPGWSMPERLGTPEALNALRKNAQAAAARLNKLSAEVTELLRDMDKV